MGESVRQGELAAERSDLGAQGALRGGRRSPLLLQRSDLLDGEGQLVAVVERPGQLGGASRPARRAR